MNNNNDLREFLNSLKGGKCLILTTKGLRYETANLQVSEDSVIFTDRLGFRVFLKIDEIAQATEKKQ